ncbi:MAG: HEAT repeat domain-containing protein [Armatimonadota bacterium]
MTNDKRQTPPDELFERQDQPHALKEMLKSVELARRQISLYGVDHPNSREVIEGLAECVRKFLVDYECATCVFTVDAVIVNEHYFTASTDSVGMFQRIRARGVMAITFVGTPPLDQLTEFLAFLNIEPRDVRIDGGPSAYLRKRGVSRIVLTESVYTRGEESDGEIDNARLDWDPKNADRAVASALDWLTRQDDESDEDLPKLPIAQILSQPDSAAKLIREAVTKLHASRRDNTSGEIASEVVHDLKSLAGASAEDWDKATPQIRKAISKLPQAMRPSFSGFTFEEDEQTADTGKRPMADVGEVETMVDELLWDGSKSEPSADLPKPSSFERLFGARAQGPMSAWRTELQPRSVMNSTGTTLVTLLRWENSACEHSRIASALAELTLRALEINNLESALLFTASLIDDANREMETGWRRSNARSALQGLQAGTLVTLVKRALVTDSYEARRIAASIVDLCPEIALQLIDLTEAHTCDEFRQSLSRAIIKAGTSAAATLSNLLREGTPSGKLAALETLVEIGRAWALEEVADVVKGEDTALAVRALKLLPTVRIPMVSEILVGALTHQAVEVRCAALDALGEFGDQSALSHLDRIASRRPLFGRSKFEAVRQTAERAAARIRHEHPKAA